MLGAGETAILLCGGEGGEEGGGGRRSVSVGRGGGRSGDEE